MARIGSFDPELDPLSWFDTESRPEGWFDDELIVAELAAGALEPPFLLSGNQFYSASVSAGPVTLTTSLYSNAQSFPAHSISQSGGLQTLTAGLYTNTNAFYGPSVSVGVVTLSPDLYAPGNTFYSAAISQAGLQTLSPGLFDSANVFYRHAITGGVTVSPASPGSGSSLYSNSDYRDRDYEQDELAEVIDPVAVEEYKPFTIPVSADTVALQMQFKQLMRRLRAAQEQQALMQAQVIIAPDIDPDEDAIVRLMAELL